LTESIQLGATMTQSKESNASDGKVQGEGDYDAARRYREKVGDFVKHAHIDKLAEDAKPVSAQEESDLTAAEDRGRIRSKGDDPADSEIMSTNQDNERSGKARGTGN